MPFSFTPGQQPPQPSSAIPQNSTVAPPLVVPSVPSIATAGNAQEMEVISPFAYKNRSKSKFSVYFQFVVFAIFGVMLLAAIGLFVYQQTLTSQVEALKVELKGKQDPKVFAFDFDKMAKLSRRIGAVNQAFNEHTSARTAFLVLEDGIENPVTYTKFSLSYSESKKAYSLSLDALAPDYHSLIQQERTLRSKAYAKYLSDITLSGVSFDENKGTVTFKLAAAIAIKGLLPETVEEELSAKSASSTSAVSTSTAPQVTP